MIEYGNASNQPDRGESMNEDIVVPFTYCEPGKEQVTIKDVSHIWCDGVELHIDRWGNINILIRQGNECISADVPLKLRNSIHNKKKQIRLSDIVAKIEKHRPLKLANEYPNYSGWEEIDEAIAELKRIMKGL
jgi:hypothetical protein